MKLANILLHFPDKPQINLLSKTAKKQFLSKINLMHTDFQIKIADFGLSTILDDTTSEQTIVGTPLYQSPQVLKRR